MAGHLDRARGRIEAVLELGDDELIAALGGRQQSRMRHELERLDVGVGPLALACGRPRGDLRLRPGYPPALRALPAPPAVLHVAGGLGRLLGLVGGDPVAIVGSRRASPYGLEVARSLGRGLGMAGLSVVSGMALGIDSAAHTGALDAGAATVAVLPGSADRPYPPGKRALYRRILAGGAGVSELGPGANVPALDVPRPQPDHRGAGRDDRRGRGRRVLRGARHRPAGPRARPPGRRRTRPGHDAPGGRTERAPGCRRGPGPWTPGRPRPPVRRRRAARRARAPTPARRAASAARPRWPRVTTRLRRWRARGSTPRPGSPAWPRSSSAASSGAPPAAGSRWRRNRRRPRGLPSGS